MRAVRSNRRRLAIDGERKAKRAAGEERGQQKPSTVARPGGRTRILFHIQVPLAAKRKVEGFLLLQFDMIKKRREKGGICRRLVSSLQVPLASFP